MKTISCIALFLISTVVNAQSLQLFTEGEKMGVKDASGKVIVEPVYDKIYDYTQGYAIMRKYETTEMIESDGVMFDVEVYGYGLLDEQGKVIVPVTSKYRKNEEDQHYVTAGPKYVYIEPTRSVFSNNLMPFADSTGKWGYLNPKGEVAVPFQFQWVEPFVDGVARVEVFKTDDYKGWGLIDTQGKLLTSGPGFQYIWEPSEGVCVTEKLNNSYVLGSGLKGYVDKNGKVIIPSMYLSGWTMHNGFARVIDTLKRFAYVNRAGEPLVPFGTYEKGFDFNQGLAAVKKKDGLWGFIDTEGDMVIPFQYKTVWSNIDYRGYFGNNEEWHHTFQEGLASVEKNGKWGFIDKTGKEVIPFEYDFARGFINGLAIVTRGRKEGIIDRQLKVVVPFEYSSITYDELMDKYFWTDYGRYTRRGWFEEGWTPAMEQEE